MNKNKKRGTVILLIIMLLGIAIMSYPKISNYWNSFRQTKAILEYQKSIQNIDIKQYEKIIEDAKDYNIKVLNGRINWHTNEEEKKEYNRILNPDGTGIMGYINIPKINVNLPLYHGTEEDVLKSSIGHIEGSAFPVGGGSTHSIVSGHRGLPSSRLFTDLDKLAIGDVWTVQILNETFSYEVDQIRTVLPNDLQFLQVEKNKDLMTLLTCTPYGINTHRLLIRGHRISNKNGDGKIMADALVIQPIYIAPYIAAGLTVILFILFLVDNKRIKNRIRIERKFNKR